MPEHGDRAALLDAAERAFAARGVESFGYDNSEAALELCREKGLSGEQGVLIPATNVSNLMLRQEVVEAVAAGQFHIWPVRHVDEAIALLTGVAAGEADAEGRFPADSVNGRVDARLQELAEIRHEFSKGGEELHEHHHDHHDRHGH